MRRRQARLALLLFWALALTQSLGIAHADEGRGVGYVLSFRLGVDSEQAERLMTELAAATSKWHGHASLQGKAVARDCASSSQCVRRAGAALGVTRLGVVAIVAAAGVVRVDVRLVDTKTGNELQRTHAEYESGADAEAAARAIYDLIPRLLPGEKAATLPVRAPPDKIEDKPKPPPVQVPPVSQIPAEPPPSDMGLKKQAAPPEESGTRWWLWGGIGVAAAAATTVAVVLLLPADDNVDRAVLELPPL